MKNKINQLEKIIKKMKLNEIEPLNFDIKVATKWGSRIGFNIAIEEVLKAIKLLKNKKKD